MSIEYRSSNIALPNITVEEKYKDNVLISHRLTANAGYVMYDTSANDVDYDPETLEPIPTIFYFRQVTIPLRVPVENWTWVAVPESDVPADHIDGGSNNNPEVM